VKSIIETDKLTKVYNLDSQHSVVALKDVTCQVPQEKLTVITGPSGSGKSTLISLMAALDRPTSGRVYVDGEDIAFSSDLFQARYRKKRIGIIFQEYNLLEELSAVENVAMPLVVTNMKRAKRFDLAASLLEKVDLTDRLDHLPRQLSGGERQRVAVARSLVFDPQIIIGDEPLSNIDEETQENLFSLFIRLKVKGKTLVIVSHDRNFIQLADHVIRLVKGRIDHT